MNDIFNNTKNSIGFKGESVVCDILRTTGFIVYKRNIKKIDSEIDIVMYKHNIQKKSLNIRVIEVKTRKRCVYDLSSLNIDKKWRLIRKHIFKIKDEINSKFDKLNYSEIHFDLALVVYKGDCYKMYKYIKDVDLML